jgi:beta-mannan synthase
MSLHRTKATLIGLLEYGRANEWVVTEKLGDSVNNNNNKKDKSGDAAKKTNVKVQKKTRSKFMERSVIYLSIS